MNILCTAPVGGFSKTVDYLTSHSNVTFLEYPQYKEVLPIICNYDGFMPNARMKVDSLLLNKAKRLKVIYQPSLGKDHIDSLACKKNNITVCGLVDDRIFQSTLWSTAEFTVGLILSMLKRIRESSNAVTENGDWRNLNFIGSDIRGMTIGIIGFGNVGSKVSELLKPFGVKILKCDPYIDQKDESYVNKQAIFQRSDLVTVHVPLTEETKEFISIKDFKSMNGGYFVNASRGPILKDLDLIKAMELGLVKGASLDVISNESPDGVKGHELVNYSKRNNQLIITPHIGGSSYEYLDNIFLHSAKELIRLLALG